MEFKPEERPWWQLMPCASGPAVKATFPQRASPGPCHRASSQLKAPSYQNPCDLGCGGQTPANRKEVNEDTQGRGYKDENLITHTHRHTRIMGILCPIINFILKEPKTMFKLERPWEFFLLKNNC